MGMINNLVCEHSLPLPDSVIDDVDGDFKDVVWNEHIFYTASFFDVIDLDLDEDVLDHLSQHYTITEDDQFYKESSDKGVEKQEFTGEIFFWAEVLGKNDDHSINFRALFYKGELKELDLEDYKKRDNEKRKKKAIEFSNLLKKELLKENSLRRRITLPFRRVVWLFISIIKWIMFKIFYLLVRIEIWSNK